MSNPRSISECSRQQLYDLLWSTPTSKLAADFGISDVAIAKHCKKLNVPRPSLGYWTKVAAGQTPPKAPLPPTAGELFKEAAKRPVAKTLQVPGNKQTVIPQASELLTAIENAELDHYKRARLEDRAFPAVNVSKTLAVRVAQAFHVLVTELEPIGIRYRKFQGTHETGYFERQGDRLYINITEDIVRPDGSRVTVPYWHSSEKNEKPCGYLTFCFETSRYRPEKQHWSESAKLPLGETLAQIVAGIRKHFLDLQEQREKEAIQRAKEHAEWLKQHEERERKEAIRLQKEKEEKHAAAVFAAKKARKAKLVKAAERWRLSGSLLQFVEECERHWKSQSPQLTPEQLSWLSWAKETAGTVCPPPTSYPDPTTDGGFDPGSIPFGGPYPTTRELE